MGAIFPGAARIRGRDAVRDATRPRDGFGALGVPRASRLSRAARAPSRAPSRGPFGALRRSRRLGASVSVVRRARREKARGSHRPGPRAARRPRPRPRGARDAPSPASGPCSPSARPPWSREAARVSLGSRRANECASGPAGGRPPLGVVRVRRKPPLPSEFLRLPATKRDDVPRCTLNAVEPGRPSTARTSAPSTVRVRRRATRAGFHKKRERKHVPTDEKIPDRGNRWVNDSRTARDPVRIKKCTPRLEDIFAQGFDRALLETTRFGVEPNQIRPVESEPTKPRSVYSTGEIRSLESEAKPGSVSESSRVESSAKRPATKAPPRRAPASLLQCTRFDFVSFARAPPSRGAHTRALAPRRVEGARARSGMGDARADADGALRASARLPFGAEAGRARRGTRRSLRRRSAPPVVRVVVARVFVVVARARSRAAASAPPSAPSSLPASDDALALAVEAACDGMDARAALRWVRLERDAYAALAAYHERRAAERDTRTRQRLRALGMWRLMGKLGLDVETSERSRVMVLAWLRACRDRLRASSSLDGRAPPSARAGARRRSPSRSSSDDGEPGPRRWRDPGPATLARRSSATRT